MNDDFHMDWNAGPDVSREPVLDYEKARRNPNVRSPCDSLGTAIRQYRVLNRLLEVDHKETTLNTLPGNIDHNGNYGIIRFELGRERQKLLAEAVSLNMHLDDVVLCAVDVSFGERELGATMIAFSVSDYVNGLMRRYSEKRK